MECNKMLAPSNSASICLKANGDGESGVII